MCVCSARYCWLVCAARYFADPAIALVCNIYGTCCILPNACWLVQHGCCWVATIAAETCCAVTCHSINNTGANVYYAYIVIILINDEKVACIVDEQAAGAVKFCAECLASIAGKAAGTI